jgi:D-glycerate 3-kinase
VSRPDTPTAQELGAEVAAAIADFLQGRLDAHGPRSFILGLCGAQGSGKSTAASLLQSRLEASGTQTAVLSLDDFYLPREARRRLADTVHPLLATRGPPGTHDVGLGLQVLDALGDGRAVRLPRFDKAHDDRCPPAAWAPVDRRVELIIFEGWCVGALPQPPGELSAPINALERLEDADGRWRRWINGQLAGAYRDLFGRLDALVLLAAPDVSVVARWRTEQEHALSARSGGTAIMTDAQVERFVQHFERITRHILHEMPSRADLVLRLDEERRVVGIGGGERPPRS